MPRWSLRCRSCGRVYPDQVFVSAAERDALLTGQGCIECDDCRGGLDVMPSAPRFTVQGFNAENRYGLKESK